MTARGRRRGLSKLPPVVLALARSSRGRSLSVASERRRRRSFQAAAGKLRLISRSPAGRKKVSLTSAGFCAICCEFVLFTHVEVPDVLCAYLRPFGPLCSNQRRRREKGVNSRQIVDHWVLFGNRAPPLSHSRYYHHRRRRRTANREKSHTSTSFGALSSIEGDEVS